MSAPKAVRDLLDAIEQSEAPLPTTIIALAHAARESLTPCTAVIHHGPGHQSRTRCDITGPHGDEHSSWTLGFTMEWTGDDAYEPY